MKFKFGDRILVTAAIVRNKDENNRSYWWRLERVKPEEAIFLKRITLADGKNDGGVTYTDDGPEYNPYFKIDKYIPGAWICRKGRKPEKVFLEDCKLA